LWEILLRSTCEMKRGFALIELHSNIIYIEIKILSNHTPALIRNWLRDSHRGSTCGRGGGFLRRQGLGDDDCGDLEQFRLRRAPAGEGNSRHAFVVLVVVVVAARRKRRQRWVARAAGRGLGLPIAVACCSPSLLLSWNVLTYKLVVPMHTRSPGSRRFISQRRESAPISNPISCKIIQQY
jgi:hypothetical protein